MNRKAHFYKLFKDKKLNVDSMAEIMEIKRDTLYRKIIGRNGFSERDIKIILNALNLDFKEVFI